MRSRREPYLFDRSRESLYSGGAEICPLDTIASVRVQRAMEGRDPVYWVSLAPAERLRRPGIPTEQARAERMHAWTERAGPRVTTVLAAITHASRGYPAIYNRTVDDWFAAFVTVFPADWIFIGLTLYILSRSYLKLFWLFRWRREPRRWSLVGASGEPFRLVSFASPTNAEAVAQELVAFLRVPVVRVGYE